MSFFRNVSFFNKLSYMFGQGFSGTKVAAFIMVCAGILLAGYNARIAVHCGQVTGCVDPYWADFWLISYEDGYVRRALWGAIVRFFADGSLSYFVLNGVAFLNAVLVGFAVLCFFVSHFSIARNALLALVVLGCGPTIAVFFEVLGDPLHLAFLIFIMFCVFLRCVESPMAVWFAGFVVAALVVLFHEASVFLFLPGVFFAVCAKSFGSINTFLLGVCMLLVLLVFVFFLNDQNAASGGFGLVTASQELYVVSEQPLPSFWLLLSKELQFYFGSWEGFIGFLFKIVGALMYPLLFVVALGVIFGGEFLMRLFFFLLIPTLPLYLIAHDWGRFAIYTLCVAIMLAGSLRDNSIKRFPMWVEVPFRVSFKYGSHIFRYSLSVLVLILIYQSHPLYRIGGLENQSVVIASAFLFLVFLGNKLKVHSDSRASLKDC